MGTPSSTQYFEASHQGPGTPSDPNLFNANEITAGSFSSGAISTATSTAVSTVNAQAPDSTSISQARSQAVSAASVGSVADSKAVSGSLNTSVADSKTISVSGSASIADSKAVSVASSVPILTVVANSQTVSTADSKAVSVASGVPAGGRTVTNLGTYSANNAVFNAKDFGAKGDSQSRPLSTLFGSLALAQVVYPNAASLTDELDGVAIQAAMNAALAVGGSVYLPGLPDKYYNVNTALIATLVAAQQFVMYGDGLRSVIYSTFAGDILTIDGSGVASGRTLPRLRDFVIAGSAATQDGISLNYTHRGMFDNVFVIGCGRWGWNFRACFLNSMHGGGGANNVGAPGNIPTQPIPKGWLRLGDGPQGGGSNANSFHGCCFSGSQKTPTPITNATNATPIVITSAGHGLNTGDVVGILSVGGNTAANDAWIVTVSDANTFSLNGSVGNGAYTSGGTVNAGVGIHIQATTNSYANSFYGGSAENNSVGSLIGPLCTINVSIALDYTTSYAYQYKDRSSATSPSNSFVNSGTGGGASSFGGTTNLYGAIQLLGASAFFQVDPTANVKYNTNDASHNILIIKNNRSIQMGDSALATNATDGFPYIPTCAGPPVGVPTATTGLVPLIYDTTNDDYYLYNGAWKKVASQSQSTWVPADGSGASLVFTSVTGNYLKQGKMVTVWGALTYPSTVSGATAIISGLPFPVSAGRGGQVHFTDLGSIPMFSTTVSTSVINIYLNTGANATNANLSLKTFYFSASYYTT